MNYRYLEVSLLLLGTFLSEGICQLTYTQPPATCTVMKLYRNDHNSMFLTSCAVESPDSRNCTLTCTNPMPNAIPRLKVGVIPNCNNEGIGVQISTEDFDGTILQHGMFYSNTTIPLTSSLSYVVTVGQMSSVYLIFELYLRESDPTNGVTLHQLLPFYTIPVDSTYFNCPPPIAFRQGDSCSALDTIVRGGPYPLVGGCIRNSNCSSIRCGLSRLTSVPFSTVTLLPCTSPPSVNIVVVGIKAELEVNVTLSSSANVNFFTSSLGTLNATVVQISVTTIGFGFNTTGPDGTTALTIIPYTVIPLSLSGCPGRPLSTSSTTQSTLPAPSTFATTVSHSTTTTAIPTQQLRTHSTDSRPRTLSTTPPSMPTTPPSTPTTTSFTMNPLTGITLPNFSTPPSIPYKLRLIGGKNYLSGRLEVKINHTWGTVCDHRNDFSSNAATFACKQLQFGRGGFVRFGLVSKLGYSNISYSLPVAMSDVNCPSYPSRYSPSVTIQNLCQYQRPPSPKCSEGMNVALECTQCSEHTCEDGRCATRCNGVRECIDGSDEGKDVCPVGSGLSTTAKVAIGLVVGIIALLIAITVATILAAWAFSGRRSTKASDESSADIPAMKYTTLEED